MNEAKNSHDEKVLKDAYDSGTEISVERIKPDSTVLSVRISRSILEDLTRVARERSLPVGRIAREYIERGLSNKVKGSEEPRSSMIIVYPSFGGASEVKRCLSRTNVRRRTKLSA